MTPHDDILALLARIEREYDVRIVYACESGSRAWGFESPDSDYDVRFLFVHPERTVGSVRTPKDTIDLPIEGLLDVGGWDVRKAAGLLGKSNGALVEWLHSPIVYRATGGFLERWRRTAREVFSPSDSARHYRGLARQMVRGKLGDPAVRAKDYLYALRGLLAARWVTERCTPPPVPLADLLPCAPDAVRALVPDLLAHKARTGEGERMARIAELDAFLEGELAREVAGGTDAPDVERRVSVLDALVRRERAGAYPAPRASALTLERVRCPDLLLFDAVAGSRAYGTALEGSDEDRRGVFVAPQRFLLGLDTIEQVSDERNDQTYYELGRFVAFLLKNNPNALELLAMPEDCVRYRHPLFAELRTELFLSKLCAKTFGEYARGQIRRARGLNKKILNPEPEERRSLLSFCRVPEGQGSTPIVDWLARRGLRPEECGLTAVQGAAGLHAVYHDPDAAHRGLVSPKNPDALHFSSVARGAEPIAWMHCNLDAFQAHCKAHRSYWDWVERRNEERYRTTEEHGRGYDGKNLLHTMRLLEMALEIATEGVIRVRRPNRDALLRIRSGEHEYDDIVARADALHAEVVAAFEASSLPDEPDRERANALLVELRAAFG